MPASDPDVQLYLNYIQIGLAKVNPIDHPPAVDDYPVIGVFEGQGKDGLSYTVNCFATEGARYLIVQHNYHHNLSLSLGEVQVFGSRKCTFSMSFFV